MDICGRFLLCARSLRGIDVKQAVERLLAGKNLIIPTETVYGVGALYDRDEAVLRIFEMKERPRFNPLIVHVSGIDMAGPLVGTIDPLSRHLIERYWPGPLTLILPKTDKVSPLLTAGLSTVALRAPAHPVARELLKAVRTPIAAPSANLSGNLSATRIEDLDPILLEKVGAYVDGGPCQVGLESTVVRAIGSTIEILRPGTITADELRAVTGAEVRHATDDKIMSPGQQASHYAPRTRLVAGNRLQIPNHGKVGLLLFSPLPGCAFPHEVLSATGDLHEAAQNLFSALKRLDDQSFDFIFAEEAPESGIGVAINDRLRRAAHTTLP